ncbi:MAG: MFS transporter [Pseudonocardiaceae bacterium]|nr:MFS transporter [Pseudonocardiaceae bacterium]
MSRPASPSPPREVRDVYGRRYRVGESARELLGYSRGWVPWAAGLAMLAASVGQYGYAVLLPALAQTHGWTPAQGFWVLAIWAASQAATVYPVTRLRSRFGVPPSATMLAGAVLCATGLVTLGGSSNVVVVVVNHAILGGIGAGLIYGTGVGVVARWYPEHPARTYFVSGAFAYGSIPFVVLAGQLTGQGSVGSFLVVAGVAVLVLVGAAAVVLKDPPVHWWPAHIDPKLWAVDKSVNPGLRHNRPAVRHYSPAEVLRCPVSGLLYAAVLCAAAVALFNIAYVGMFTITSGWSAGFAATAVGVLAGASGVTRAAAGWAGDRFGRGRTVWAALMAGGAAQLLLLVAGEFRLSVLLLAACGLAGASAGSCYALLPGLVEDHFGDRAGLPNFGLFYGAKAVGALLGVGLAAPLLVPNGYPAGFGIAALLSVSGALFVGMLRRPGFPRLLLPDGNRRPATAGL